VTIILISNRVPPAVDGVGDYTLRLARAFASAGHAVHIICKVQEVASAPEGITVHPIVQIWDRSAARPLIRLIMAIQPDWVGLQYVPNAFQKCGLPLALPGLLRQISQTGVPVWVTFHEVHVRLHGWSGRLVGGLQRRVARALCHLAKVCVTSIGFYQQLLAPYHANIHLIPIGSNIEPGAVAAPQREALRQRLFPGLPYVVSTFGIRRHKNLLAALQRARAAGLRAGLLVCGHVAEKDIRHDLPWVHYTGYLPAEAVCMHLQCSDLFVLPDFVGLNGEGGTCTKSGSLAAAYAAGLPVVGMRGDMNNHLLRPGQNIALCANDQPETVARIISDLLRDAGQRQNLATGGKRLFSEHLSWPRLTEAYLSFLQKRGDA
jgi:glycosyltransferase involved in cell wall biosynthesis